MSVTDPRLLEEALPFLLTCARSVEWGGVTEWGGGSAGMGRSTDSE